MSRAFRYLLDVRESLYESGIFRARRLDSPVVSVGNLTVGGTGKTPLVIALAERFLRDGYKPVVLSRGYKRTSKGIVVVSRGGGPLVDWHDAGDEPWLIARRVPNAAVVVGADRYEAGILAQREQLGNVFILDDGFQHRRLQRDADLVTIDPAEWAGPEKLLPVGRWREPKSAITRAHAACVLKRDGMAMPHLPIPSFEVETNCDGVYHNDAPVHVRELAGRPIVALAAIAKPERFFASLESLGIAIAHRAVFADHHAFTHQDLARVFNAVENAVVITTEKDAVRLAGLAVREFLHLRISANIAGIDRLMQLICDRFPRHH